MADFGISEGIALAGVVASVATASAAAIAQNNQAKFQEDTANNNATAAQQQAAYENQLNQINLEKTLGAEQATMGQGGVTGGSGQDITYNTLVMGKLDQLATTYQGNVRSTAEGNSAALDQAEGQNALTSGLVSVAGSGASGYAKVSSINNSQAGVGATFDSDEDEFAAQQEGAGQ